MFRLNDVLVLVMLEQAQNINESPIKMVEGKGVPTVLMGW